MFTQYFGNYLYESNIISMNQFKDALQQMKVKRARLGVLAIQAGDMTPAQVEETSSAQLHTDKKFGEIAIQKGYITQAQLEKLLASQGSPFAVFSQILIDSAYMTYSQLSEHLASYKTACGMSEESFSKFQKDEMTPVIEKILPRYADPQREKIVRSYTELFFRNITRFISDNVLIGDTVTPEAVQGGWISCQRMYGTLTIISSYSSNDEAMRSIAGKFAKAPYADFDVLARDVAGEFLNCNNGIFIANALEYGVNLDLDPQYVTNDFASAQTPDMFRLDFSVDSHRYQLNLAF